jgi:hypothetical protein
MVPDDLKMGVAMAKKVCMTCPVVSQCLATAEQVTRKCGPGSAQGIWGGLTENERAVWATLGRRPITCSRCGQRCVPMRMSSTCCVVCSAGDPWYNDYRPLIEQLLSEGLGTDQIAVRLRLRQKALDDACRRWELARPALRKGARPTQGCGTLAAKTRHQRHGEDWRKCACRNVAWRKGKYRKAKEMVGNTTKS